MKPENSHLTCFRNSPKSPCQQQVPSHLYLSTVPSLGSVDRAVVGVIDGGVAGPFANPSHYVVGRAGLVAAEHRGLDQVNHGTRIASLVALGSALNPGLLPPSEDCRVPRETSGLRAVDSFGQPGDVQGTSFAAPLVSRYLATLDATIASDVSRELLIALAAHSAAVPTALDDRRLRSISSSFVGRGNLPSVEETLDGTPHRISIVLSDTILPGRCVDFPFTWPPSLVTPEGACRGNVRLTLATQPAIANVHGWERVRVNRLCAF